MLPSSVCTLHAAVDMHGDDADPGSQEAAATREPCMDHAQSGQKEEKVSERSSTGADGCCVTERVGSSRDSCGMHAYDMHGARDSVSWPGETCCWDIANRLLLFICRWCDAWVGGGRGHFGRRSLWAHRCPDSLASMHASSRPPRLSQGGLRSAPVVAVGAEHLLLLSQGVVSCFWSGCTQGCLVLCVALFPPLQYALGASCRCRLLGSLFVYAPVLLLSVCARGPALRFVVCGRYNQ